MLSKQSRDKLFWLGLATGVCLALLPGVLYKVAKEYKALKAKEMKDKILKYFK